MYNKYVIIFLYFTLQIKFPHRRKRIRPARFQASPFSLLSVLPMKKRNPHALSLMISRFVYSLQATV